MKTTLRVALVLLASLATACGPSISILHAQAGHGEVQADAPLHARMDGPLLTWFYGQKELDLDMARSLANLEAAAEGQRRTSM